MNLTPQETFDYKMSWLPGNQVALHSDLRMKGKDWCKDNVPQMDYKFIKYTGPYEDTYCFKNKSDAETLIELFPTYAKEIV